MVRLPKYCWSSRDRTCALLGLLAAAAAAIGCGGDSDSSASSAKDASACKPGTCAELGAECGRLPDGCDGIAECGGCAEGLHCGGDGPNRCGANLCKPRTCALLGASCGVVSDQCADVLDCGGCPAPQVCSAAVPNQCGCNPRSCAQMDANCGTAPDGCGNAIECGECPQGQTCGAGGPNRCGQGTCAARTCAQAGASCGMASDGCADVLDCGSCAPPSVCGGSGAVNQCGCTNKTCAQVGASCGAVPGGCGADIQCGSCPADDTCGGGGQANQCGCPCKLLNATTSCAGAPCHIKYCDDGWGDCDGSQQTGCETDLMGATVCPTPCDSESQCPGSFSCIGGWCAPWPVGLIVPWGGNTLPAGWLEADGAVVKRSEWKELYAAIGTSFGAGDATTTFQLPDLRGRFALGQAKSGTGSALADRFGMIDHQHAVAPAPHSHAVGVAAHSHEMAALPPHIHGWYFTAEVKANPGPNQVFLMSQTGETEPASGGPFTTSSEGGASLTTSSEASVVTIATANPPYLSMRSIILAKRGAEAPCGAVWWDAKGTPATGSQPASGAKVSRVTDAWLFKCLGTTFGAGDGSTTFDLPDLRGRSALGKSQFGTGTKVGEAGGALEHVHQATIDAIAHSLSLPAHTHTAAEPAHTHSVVTPAPGYAVASGSQFGVVTGFEPQTGSSPGPTETSKATGAATLTVPAAGVENAASSPGSSPFLVVQPVLFQSQSHRLPAGTIVAFAGVKVPYGWLVADGSAVSRSKYAGLFAAIGTTYGAGDGTTTFNVPDLRGRAALGRADSGLASQLGASGGALDHTHEVAIPQHAHTVVFPQHTHLFSFYHHMHTLAHTQILATYDFAAVDSARGVDVQLTGGGLGDATSQPGAAPAATSSQSGGGNVTTGASNAPYLVLRYIIQI